MNVILFQDVPSQYGGVAVYRQPHNELHVTFFAGVNSNGAKSSGPHESVNWYNLFTVLNSLCEKVYIERLKGSVRTITENIPTLTTCAPFVRFVNIKMPVECTQVTNHRRTLTSNTYSIYE